MADAKLKRRIREFFREQFVHGPDEWVRVNDGFAENVHVEVVSHKYDGMNMVEKHDLTWSVLLDALPKDVWGYISLVEEHSPQENGRTTRPRRVKRA
jgi:stress-induced morphogen